MTVLVAHLTPNWESLSAGLEEQRRIFVGHVNRLRTEFPFLADRLVVLAVETGTGLEAARHWRDLVDVELTDGVLELREDKGRSGIRMTPELKLMMVGQFRDRLSCGMVMRNDRMLSLSAGEEGPQGLLSKLGLQLRKFSGGRKLGAKGPGRAGNDDLAMALMLNMVGHMCYESHVNRARYRQMADR